MSFKDIVNRDIVNLTNCENEPIHVPGSIQPHGFLLGLEEDTFTINFCSENCADYTGIPYTEALGKTFEEIFGSQAKEGLEGYIQNNLMLSSSLLRINLAGKPYLCTVHKSKDIYIVEAEPDETVADDGVKEYNNTSKFLSYMSNTNTLKELCDLVAKGTRDITGYDRVMIYRFDKDYNGEVLAESRREDLEPFLGLHYPHTDIPVQARKLYIKNLLRLITDVNYTPVPIYTVDNKGNNEDLDLSLSILRSTSPIHVQYLENMGVGATLTISLIHKNKLWGLIACHHYSPKNISPEIRLAAQLQGHFITSQIDLRQSYEEYEISRKTKIAHDSANELALNSTDSFADFVQSHDVLQLCNAAGVSIVFNGAVYKSGLTPTDDEIQYMANWLATFSNNSTYVSESLAEVLPEYNSICGKVSGILYHSLNVNNNNCIIWYRPETRTEVKWAGDPTKAIIKDEKGLSPRKSFEAWNEIVSCKASPWLKPEIEAAHSYAYSLQKQINLLIVTQEEEKYRTLSELLQETNSELENINWISTHDLQEPLRKIQLISSRLLVKEKNIPENVQDAIIRMNNSASRMQTLLVDILKYTRLKHTQSSFETVDLNEVINEVEADLPEAMGDNNGKIIKSELPNVWGIQFLLKQLFTNIITNSIKYAANDREPEIKISASDEPIPFRDDDKKLYHVIYVADNGIGFDQQFAESIFNIFTRLHGINEYKGSGVGLALCKKIMQNHKGYIKASSTPGEGTTISIFFPA